MHIVRSNSCRRSGDEPALVGMTVLCLLYLHMILVRVSLECNPAIQMGVSIWAPIGAQKGLFSFSGLCGDKERRQMASTPIGYMCPTSLYFTLHSMSGLLVCSWWQRSECENFSFGIHQHVRTTAIISPATHSAQHTAQSAQHTSMQKNIRSNFPQPSEREVQK